MAIAVAIYDRATGHAGTTALISARCYPLLVPQDPTLPAVSYQVISRVNRRGEPLVQEVRIQIDAWAATYAGVDALAEQLRAAFDSWRDTTGDTQVIWSQQINETDIYEPDQPIWRISQDYLMKIVET